ncbi:calcium-activated potassium channel slo-1 [Ditylenchus destructor]|nr:calcium-activated potassium channel slo-1 [Ditylenchus destructor]
MDQGKACLDYKTLTRLQQMNQNNGFFGTNSSMTFDSGNMIGNLSEFYLNLSEDECKCLIDRKYWAFLISSIDSYLVIVLLILCWRIAKKLIGFDKLRHRSVVTHMDKELSPGYIEYMGYEECVGETEEKVQKEKTFEEYLDHLWANNRSVIASAISWPYFRMDIRIQKLFVVLLCLASIGSVVIYFIDISKDPFLVEICKPLSQSLTQQIDLGLNIFFLAFFVKRFIDAPDKIRHMICDPSTLADLFLIPPSFLSVYLGRSWTGMRHITVLRFMYFPEFIFLFGIIKLENSGDAWTDHMNAHRLSYLECLYSVIVAFLTAGFKHGYCTTVLGRCFLVIMVVSFVALQISKFVCQQRGNVEGSKDKDDLVSACRASKRQECKNVETSGMEKEENQRLNQS